MIGSINKWLTSVFGKTPDNSVIVKDLIKQIERSKPRSIAIYGCGDIGQLLTEKLSQRIDISFYLDAKARFDTLSIDGKPVHTLLSAKEDLTRIDSVVIASYKFREEMSAMLKDFTDDPAKLNIIKY